MMSVCFKWISEYIYNCNMLSLIRRKWTPPWCTDWVKTLCVVGVCEANARNKDKPSKYNCSPRTLKLSFSVETQQIQHVSHIRARKERTKTHVRACTHTRMDKHEQAHINQSRWSPHWARLLIESISRANGDVQLIPRPPQHRPEPSALQRKL